MARLRPYRAVAPALIVAALTLSACGSRGIQVAKDSPYREGATTFAERCSGCHTLKAAGAEGSVKELRSVGPPTAGPNLDTRKETLDSVLYAIRNGGFSGAIMPQNIVVGDEARQVARFVAKYAGHEAGKTKAGKTGQ